jgi:spermidine/putrescine transport system permease protein
MMANKLPASTILSAIYAILVYGFIFLPVIVLVLFSFQDGRLPIPPLKGLSLRWYYELFSEPGPKAALINSIIVGVASSALATMMGFLAAYGLARFRLPASGLQRGLITAPLMVSYLVIGLGLLITFNATGFPKSLVAAGIGHVVINMPLCFAIIYSQMGAHQINIERAARDLGAKDWQVLLLITAPVLWPAIFASFLLSLTFSWDEFIISFLLTRFEVTLPIEIWSMLRSGLSPKTNAAGSIVFTISVFLVLIVEIVIFRRRRTV